LNKGERGLRSAVAAFTRVVLHARLVVLAVTIGLTLWLGALASSLKVSISTDDILPESHPYVRVIKEARSKFGAELPYIVVFTNLNGPATSLIKVYEAFSREVLTLPNVKGDRLLSLASSKTRMVTGSADGLKVEGVLDELPTNPTEALAVLRHRIETSPIHERLFLSRDGRSLAAYVEFTPSLGGYSGDFLALESLANRLGSERMRVDIGGQSSLLAETELMSNRMGIFFPLAILIIGLIHFESFRSSQAVVLPVLTGLIATVWSVGLFSAAGFALDPFNALAPVLILAVGAGHAVQVLKRYTEVYAELPGNRSRARQDAAIVAALSDVAPPLLAAAAVAISAFLSLMLFDAETIRRFGMLVAFGIASIVAIEFTFIPALRSLLPPPREVSPKPSPIWGAITSTASFVAGSAPVAIIVLSSTIAVIAGFGIARIDLSSSMKTFFSPEERINASNRFVNSQFAGTDGFYVLIDARGSNTLRTASTMGAISAMQATMEADPIVTKTLSISDFVSQIYAAVQGRQSTARTGPRNDGELQDALGLYELSVGPSDFEAFVSADYRRALVRVFVNSDRSSDLKRVEAKIIGSASQTGLDRVAVVTVGGGSFGPVALSERIVPEKIKNIAVILFACFVVATVAMRSWLIGLACCVPLILSGLVVFGTMGWGGIPLQTITATLGALCLGIGADYAIYLSWRLQQETAAGDVRGGISRAVESSGKAVLFVASAITGGFAILGFSQDFHVHQWMALLVGLAMITNALAALFLLPALFAVVARIKRAA
jgi:predicted RND superfamily exporter protein